MMMMINIMMNMMIVTYNHLVMHILFAGGASEW